MGAMGKRVVEFERPNWTGLTRFTRLWGRTKRGRDRINKINEIGEKRMPGPS
jgi:hypothetical protein